jgi:hypothetical protein
MTVLPGIVVDAEGNLMLDSQDVAHKFNVHIDLDEKGMITFSDLACGRAHCLGQVVPKSIRLLTGEDGTLAVVHGSQRPQTVSFRFDKHTTSVDYTAISGMQIGILSITKATA